MKYTQHFQNFLAILILLCSGALSGLSGQVVTTIPTLPIVDDSVTIIFDATQGNGGLAGFGGTVYMHSGVITDKSTTPTDWKHVPMTWGTADARWAMDKIGPNQYQKKYHIRNFYQVPQSDTVKKLAFVFRNDDGSRSGRDLVDSDIFVDVAQPGLDISFTSPNFRRTVLDLGDSVDIVLGATDADTLRLFVDGVEVAKSETKSLTYRFHAGASGTSMLRGSTEVGNQTKEVFATLFVKPASPTVASLPNGLKNGINYINDSTVTLVLFAPGKDHVFVLGEFNDWFITDDNYMNITPDRSRFWKTITGLTPGKEYVYQYLIDSEILTADYLSEKILDPWSDPWIPEANYPNLKPYPSAFTNGLASIFQTAQPDYQWQTQNFTPPKVEDLFIYELHARDFSDNDDFQTIIDSLDYLENLGVNAIQLMPVMEFENNDSWGYNPSFMLALDKYYGTPEKFKELVDKCHARGIAVILDIVLNHQFGQSPMVRMYWDEANSRPAANSPWFNPVPKHDFNVGYDMNHESQATKDFSYRVVKHWIEEYRIDGYRFDLSKGFTQKNTLGNTGAWGQRDEDRIRILKALADTIWAADPDSYVILEHFADNAEEIELANYGMMLWGNIHFNYSEAAMGYHDNGKSDFNWISYQNRGWNDPHVVGYMESHDEERLMYRNLQFGARNASRTYNIKDLETGLDRMELAGAFFFTVPGPKMIWQFGELGYDVSIDDNGRTGRKPIRWNYYQEPGRRRLYRVWAALAKLKAEEPAFETRNFNLDVRGEMKRIQLNHPDMNVTVLGNFSTNPGNITPNFQQVGTWYEFFTGDTLRVTNTTTPINLLAGEYRLYTTKRLTPPNLSVSRDDDLTLPLVDVYPNPASSRLFIDLVLPEASHLKLSLLDISGKQVALIQNTRSSRGLQSLSWDIPDHLPAGMYFMAIQTDTRREVRKVFIR